MEVKARSDLTQVGGAQSRSSVRAEGSAGRNEPQGKEEGALIPWWQQSWVLVESGPCEGVCGRTDLQTGSGSV